jgi:lipopolysaccharide transport system permease protein
MIGYFRTLFSYRELLYFLVLRETKAKYKQTVLGVAWSVLQPLSLMVVFTVVFSLFARLPSDGVPYALFSYCALLPWQFFAGVLGRGVGSLLSNQVLVQKVYFPREIILFAVVASAVVDFAVGASLFVALLWFYQIPWGWHFFLIFPVFLIQLFFVAGLILILSPLNVFYRDINMVMPLLVQIWMFATPIIYPLSLVPEALRPYYALNPMAGVVDAYRQILLHDAAPDPLTISFAAIIATLTLVGGLLYFKKVEFELADVM